MPPRTADRDVLVARAGIDARSAAPTMANFGVINVRSGATVPEFSDADQ
jgi:hypothetical protein